jgi:hypothetical protein
LLKIYIKNQNIKHGRKIAVLYVEGQGAILGFLEFAGYVFAN